jgi:membrane protein YdbS with pleckstrin-like domain
MLKRKANGDLIELYPAPNYRTKLWVASLFTLFISTVWIIPGLLIAAAEGEIEGSILSLVMMLFLVGIGITLFVIYALVRLYYRSIRYEIHPDEIVVYAGILTKSVKHVPFRTVTNLTVARGPLDRWLGIGGLSIQTAGSSGTATPEEKLVGLTDVQEVYEYIAGELRRFRGAMSPTTAEENSPVAPTSANDEPLLNAILEELRAIRAGLEQR